MKTLIPVIPALFHLLILKSFRYPNIDLKKKTQFHQPLTETKSISVTLKFAEDLKWLPYFKVGSMGEFFM